VAQQIGGRLGSYEIVAPLGAGGMGEVYRARDTKLGREVAIKVLPEALSQDKERLARFEREAKLLASLNHPGIATLFGLEEEAGKPFLVMELVEGETLAAQIARGPLSVEVALPLFQQIAEALEAAHEKAIIHRDLKPANIKVTPEGKVKVLDFGLAKAFAPQESQVDDSSQSPTLTKGTALGAIMGTPSYMSPEQAKGKPVDQRTDVWAFGCVVYEALTGRRAFEGDDVSETLASVLRDEPRWQAIPGFVPRKLIGLVRRCLRRDFRRRVQHIGDLRVELEDIATGSEPVEIGGSKHSPTLLRLALAGLVAALGIAAWGWLRSQSTATSPVTRSSIELEHPLALSNPRPVVAISADGSRLAALVQVEGTTQIYLRDLSELEGRLIPGTEDAVELFFSPDGQSLGFVAADGWLKAVSLSGGAPVAWSGLSPVTRGGTWVSEEQIVMNTSINAGLSLITGSKRTRLTRPDAKKDEGSHRWPHVVPGRPDTVLFTIARAGMAGSSDEANVGVLSLETGDTRIVLEGGASARSTVSGHLVFGRSGGLLAALFDASTLEVTGVAVRVIQNAMSRTNGAVHYAVSDGGTLVYVEGPVWTSNNTVQWIGAQGNAEPIIIKDRRVVDVALSPNGERLGMTVAHPSNTEIWTYDLTRGTQTRLTFDPGEDFNPIWSPDGTWIAFASEMNGEPPQLHRMRADGTGDPELLLPRDRTDTSNADIPTSWSPDGKFLAFHSIGDIWLVSLDEPDQAATLVQSEFQEHGASFSPDGKWLAYHTNESGRAEVYVQPFPGPGGKEQVSTDGGTWPHWDGTGRRLFYRNRDRLMEVTVAIEPDLALSKPRELFRGKYSYGIGHSNYDVSKDGRFLMISVDEPPAQTRLRLVTNWFEELERLVPTKGEGSR
jgi:serine/threonine-protein kinase